MPQSVTVLNDGFVTSRESDVLQDNFDEVECSERQEKIDKRRLSGWVVVAKAPDGIEMRSSAVSSRERAIGLAHDLADKGDEVLRIEGPGGDVTGEGIAAGRPAPR